MEGLEQRLALSGTMAGVPNSTTNLGDPVCSCAVISRPPPTPTSYDIETSGSVTLRFDTTSNGGFRANGQLITFDGQPFKGNTDWQAVAADVVDGVNTVVLRHWPGQPAPGGLSLTTIPQSKGHLHFWRMDSEWRYVSSDGWIPMPPPPSPLVVGGSQPPLSIGPPATASESTQFTAFYATERAFGADLNRDSVVMIDAAGEVTLTYGHGGSRTLGVKGRAMTSIQAISFNDSPVSYSSLVAGGWTPVAAEYVEGVNTVVLRHTSGHLHFWRMDADWNQVGGQGWVAPGTNDFFTAEVTFGVDLDGDGGLTIENVGSVVLDYAPDGNIRANGTPVMFNGSPMNYFSMVAAGWTPRAADEDQGVNTVVLEHSSGYLHFWRMDASWNQIGGDGWVSKSSRAFFAAEVAFGADLDGDGARTIEAKGNALLVYDRAGQLRVPSKINQLRVNETSKAVESFYTFGTYFQVIGTTTVTHGRFITFNGKPYNYLAGIKSGWRVMAADDHDNQNTVLLKHIASGHLHFWRMDASWNQVGGDGWVAPGSPAYFAAEIAFGVDLDESGAIGA